MLHTEKLTAPARSDYFLGVTLAVFTIFIWAGWFLSTRFLVLTDLSAYDIAALRFGVAGIVLAPVVWKRGFAFQRVGWKTFSILCIGAGAPYVLTIAGGLSLASASHGAALTPGVMPLFVAILSVALFGERMVRSRQLGFTLIFGGVLLIAGLGLFLDTIGQTSGHILFLTGAFLWASYTLALRQSGLSPLHATAVLSVVSCALYIPAYLVFLEPRIFDAPAGAVLFAGLYQGFLTSVVSLITYSRAVAILGASRAAAFASLIPVLTLLFGIPLLGEWPSLLDILGIGLVSAGVFLAASGKLESGPPALR